MTAIEEAASERRLSLLLRARRDDPEPEREGVAVVDPEGDVETVNRAFASRFGYDREALVGSSWRALLADGEGERLESTAVPSVEDGWRWVGSCRCRRRDGERIAVQLRIVGLDDGSKAVVVADGGDAPEER